MDKTELFELLNNAQEDIDTEMRQLFEKSDLYKKYQKIIELTIFDDNLEDEILDKIDNLTDNMDKLNFYDVKKDINELKEILRK